LNRCFSELETGIGARSPDEISIVFCFLIRSIGCKYPPFIEGG
jgi:hypothetical protein